MKKTKLPELKADDITDFGTFTVSLPLGLTGEVMIETDEDCGPPWKEHDGHGVVSDWVSRDKHPSERVLNSDHGSKRYYDFAETMKRAKADGWGLGDDEKAKLAVRLGRAPTKGEVTAEAVERDFAHLLDWCNDGWTWMYYRVTVTDENGKEVGSDSCGGFDGDTPYFRGEVADALNYIVSQYADAQKAARKAARIERKERSYWEARDTITAS